MMNTSLRNRGLALGLFLLVLVAGAPAALGQTPFALRSVGQPLVTEDARMVGRGGWGMAVNDSMHPGFKNLASLSSIKHVVISFTGYGEHADNEDVTGSRKTSRTLTPDIRMALPVVKERFALTAGFQIYRSSEYTTLQPVDFGVVWDDTVTGGTQFRREGNQFRVPLGAAWRILPRISLSGAFNLENGSVREELTNFYDWPNLGTDTFGSLIPLYLTDIKESKDEYRGQSYTLGFLLDPFSWLQLAGSWTPAYDLDVTRTVYHLGVSERYDDAFTMTMPEEYKAGIQLGLGGRWRVGGDASYMNYKEMEGRPDWVDESEEEIGYSVGIERKPAQARRGGANNLPFRAGYSRKQWGYSINGEPVIEETFSLGTGFPFRGNLGQLDLALSFGMIGDMASNQMESSYWRFTLSVVGLERWW